MPLSSNWFISEETKKIRIIAKYTNHATYFYIETFSIRALLLNHKEYLLQKDIGNFYQNFQKILI